VSGLRREEQISTVPNSSRAWFVIVEVICEWILLAIADLWYLNNRQVESYLGEYLLGRAGLKCHNSVS
jgi:hypothetical protein